MSRNADRGDPHGWNSLEHYLSIHDAHLQRFVDEGFVVSHDLPLRSVGPQRLLMRGRIRCQHGLFIDVVKELEVENRGGRPFVRTEQYSYHAGIEGDRQRTLFRYDNAHSYPGHDDAHHKHGFNHTTWQRIEPPEWIGRANWPHLSDVIEEVWGWWNETGRFWETEEEDRTPMVPD